MASVSLTAVGDILMHQDVKRAASEADGGLQSLWAEVAPLFREADIAFANLETPVAPTSGRPGVPFQFNAPAELPAALRASGLTVLSTANNHAYDQGPQGVEETLRRLEAEHLTTVGSGLTRAQAEAPRILEVKGLRVAFLGFTELFNANFNRRADQVWVRALDLPAALAAVRAVRPQADIVIVSLHWGTEYEHAPSSRQRKAAAALAEAGADVILGHHPHVLQPVAWVEAGGRRTIVAYSMGNFVSNQDRIYHPEKSAVEEGDSRDGVAFQCRLVKRRWASGRESCGVEQVRCEPLWTENNWTEHQAGRARRREIGVIPVNGAMRDVRRDQGRGGGQELEARMRLLEARRHRAASILGPEFVEGEDGASGAGGEPVGGRNEAVTPAR